MTMITYLTCNRRRISCIFSSMIFLSFPKLLLIKEFIGLKRENDQSVSYKEKRPRTNRAILIEFRLAKTFSSFRFVFFSSRKTLLDFFSFTVCRRLRVFKRDRNAFISFIERRWYVMMFWKKQKRIFSSDSCEKDTPSCLSFKWDDFFLFFVYVLQRFRFSFDRRFIRHRLHFLSFSPFCFFFIVIWITASDAHITTIFFLLNVGVAVAATFILRLRETLLFFVLALFYFSNLASNQRTYHAFLYFEACKRMRTSKSSRSRRRRKLKREKRRPCAISRFCFIQLLSCFSFEFVSFVDNESDKPRRPSTMAWRLL